MTKDGIGLSIPRGFLFSAVKAGIKASGNLDLGLIEAPMGASAAALFTTNRAVAAPLIVDKEHLRKTKGRLRAVVVNAGNANCATGKDGIKAAREVCIATGRLLEAAPEFIFPSSTGIIGVPLPTHKLVAGLPQLTSSRNGDEAALRQFAHAIMTTDTREKFACATLGTGKNQGTIVGVAKGSGMIHPNLATMLVYILTDMEATPQQLQRALRGACEISFNRITVDGDTSTNDTVLLLASGASGVKLSRQNEARFQAALQQVCSSLARQIIEDGEGAKHVVELTVEGARNSKDADAIARTIAHSMLVKTAWAGADPNWGRILAAAGRSGVNLDPAKVSIYIGKQAVFRNGAAVKFDVVAAHEEMTEPSFSLRVKVGKGSGKVTLLTCDLTTEYVHINADYST